MLTAATILICIALLYAARQAPAAPGPRLTTLIAAQQIATWRCQDQLGWPRTKASVSPWALPKSHAYRVWVLRLWTQRHSICRAAQRELERQWNWQQWLPRNWQLLGACETGYGQVPGNWAHSNSSYVSAFGIQRGNRGGQYDDDARKAGMPPWSDNPRKRPTPWQQYQTALSHYRSFGDGWECPGP